MKILHNKDIIVSGTGSKRVFSIDLKGGYQPSHIWDPVILPVPLERGTNTACSEDEQQHWKKCHNSCFDKTLDVF